MGTTRAIVAEGTEGTLNLGPERPRVYLDLSQDEKDRYNADIRATNIILQAVKLNKGLKDSNNFDQLYAYLKQHEGRQNRGQGNNARGAGAVGYGRAQNRVGNANPGQARQVKCYNCNGVGHIARSLHSTQDPQELRLLQRKDDYAIDDDVVENLFKGLALNVVIVFQADDCVGVYDSNGGGFWEIFEAPYGTNYVHGNLSLQISSWIDEDGRLMIWMSY
ncbi:retrovirus-related pol polyprotein from transposon TNT 1-94 [Tanacetum coccineum]